MRTALFAAFALFAAAGPMGSAVGQTPNQTQNLEQKIWSLLDNGKAPFVALSEPDFRALGDAFGVPVVSVPPDALGEALAAAFAEEGPAVVHVPTLLEMWA